MGSGFSQLCPCLNPATNRGEPEMIFTATEPLDETLGHSFCYVRSSARFLSPTPSDRFVSPSQSLRFSPSHEPAKSRPVGLPETGFKAISGASVSANTSTPRTVLQLENIYDDAIDSVGGGMKSSIVNGFESTASFSSLPLQPLPRGGNEHASGPMERAFFMSGPIERGALSGPLEPTAGSDGGGRVPFSAPIGGMYVKKKRRKGIPGIRKAFQRNFSVKNRPWVVPVRNKEDCNTKLSNNDRSEIIRRGESDDVQWALGKAGEDRVHVVVSEEHGWLFVGIYDGFNGPDAPEFLMGNLYKAVYKELEGLFWDSKETVNVVVASENAEESNVNNPSSNLDTNSTNSNSSVKKVTFQSDEIQVRRRRLWEFLAEDDPEDGLDLSGSERFAFSVDDALSLSNTGSAVSRRSLLLSKLKHGLIRNKEGGKLFSWRFGLEGKEEKMELELENNRIGEERISSARNGRKRKVGPVDHELVLRAMSRALEVTEIAYLDMTNKVLDRYPELALMGSCLLVVLMRDEDVYVMNVGDSRAIVAHFETREVSSSTDSKGPGDCESTVEDIVEESMDGGEGVKKMSNEVPAQAVRLTALQLSTDHSTSIEEEVIRIKNEHPDDSHCIVNDRVKGRLKVTRAFGAGFLKQPKLNDAVLEMFRMSILEVVSHVECFIEKCPEGDPAQHLIEELLLRAAKKAGMDLHELLDIPQGDRRKYHDDVTVMVISLEGGRIWKSSGKYL